MPCRHDPTPEELAQEARDRVLHSKSYKDLKKKLDTVTELLCNACKLLDVNSIPIGRGPLALWWKQHQVTDADRLRRSALNKLTSEERAALGLNVR